PYTTLFRSSASARRPRDNNTKTRNRRRGVSYPFYGAAAADQCRRRSGQHGHGPTVATAGPSRRCFDAGLEETPVHSKTYVSGHHRSTGNSHQNETSLAKKLAKLAKRTLVCP